jgi:acetolactate synthase-1/2/3 large subunit
MAAAWKAPMTWCRREAAFAGGGVHLVALPVDYSENIRVLEDELRYLPAKS